VRSVDDAMEPWQWIVGGLLAWVVVSLAIGVAWSLIARELKRRHRRKC
jgi:hypothetical protein